MPLQENFRDNVERYLADSNLSKTELARQCGIHRVTIYKILSGEMEPSLAMCEQFAKVFGVEPETIFQKPRKKKLKKSA